MNPSDAGSFVVAFVNILGPIAVAAVVLALLAGIGFSFFSSTRATSRRVGIKPFDIGGPFDQFYIRILPKLKPATVHLLYTAYAAWWFASLPSNPDFPLLHQPWDNPIAGVFAALIVMCFAIATAIELLKALWFGLRWLKLEARGMQWHTADSGEPYRIIWLRLSGEYLFDTTIRNHRLQQELTAIRERRKRIVKAALVAGIWLLVWLSSKLIAGFLYPNLTPDGVMMLVHWQVLPILSWLIFLLAVIPTAVELLAAIADELVYRSGAQFIPGAKVLDARPDLVSRQHVETQNAHGDADFVSAAEAVRRMSGQSES